MLAAAIAMMVVACRSKSTGDKQTREARPKPTAVLVDLTASTTLAPVRAAFNAKKGEARFLTLLSPT